MIVMQNSRVNLEQCKTASDTIEVNDLYKYIVKIGGRNYFEAYYDGDFIENGYVYTRKQCFALFKFNNS